MQEQARELLSAIAEGSRSGDLNNVDGKGWDQARELMQSISASRARQGLNSTETATFILSLKRPLFDIVRRELAKTPEAVFEEIWTITLLLDGLALLTAEAFLATREKLIQQQQQEMMELSTPVVKLWDGILALPMIGTLDSARTQIVHEELAGYARMHQALDQQYMLAVDIRLMAEEDFHNLSRVVARLLAGLLAVFGLDELAHNRNVQGADQVGHEHEGVLQNLQGLYRLSPIIVGDLATQFLYSFLDLLRSNDLRRWLGFQNVHELACLPVVNFTVQRNQIPLD